jgi:cyclopropane-fatty-acyl-phospholipid synthase
LPSISTIVQTAADSGRMRLLHLEDLAPHYAETLRRWRDSFFANLDQVRQLGFDDRFIRMWEYYLCYCEAVFEERQVNNVQVLLAKRGCRRDPLQLQLQSTAGIS